MGQRMFVTVSPPESAREELVEFLEPRSGMPWIAERLWHITLAFCESVPEHRIDDFEDALTAAARRYRPIELSIGGAGVFPSVERAKVLWAGIREYDDPATPDAATGESRADAGSAETEPVAGAEPEAEREPAGRESAARESVLHRLSRNARAAANNIGGAPDGRPFHPHLTLARLKRPIEATKWLRVLDTFEGSRWRVDDIELVASHLGEGPNRTPRYETVARIPLGEQDHRWWLRM